MTPRTLPRPDFTRPVRLAILVIVGGLVASGCDLNPTGGAGQKLTAVKAQGDNVLLTQKEQAPYVVVNVAEDVPRLRALDSAAREESLIRTALQVLLAKGLNHKPYSGKDLFQMRLVVLHELNEYGQAMWGSMLELATFDVPRSSLEGLSASDLDRLTGPDLRKLVRNSQFSLGNLDKFA